MPSIWEDVLDGHWGFAILPGTAHTLCYQERTGASATTPASADGDPVGTVHDLISGLYITMGSDAARPTFRTAAGVSWLQFDGTDDILVATPGAYTGTVIYGVALVRDTDGPILSVTKNAEEDWNSNSRVILMGRGGAACELYRNGILEGVEYPGDGIAFVLEAQSGPTLSFIARNGGADSNETHGDAGAYDVNRVGFMCSANGSAAASGRLYGALVVGAAPSSGERADLVAAAQALLVGGTAGEADGDLVTVTTSLVAGAASGVRAPTVSGQLLAATATLVDGTATGVRSPTVSGQILTATTALADGTASGVRAPTVSGQVLTVGVSLIPGEGTGASAPTAPGQILTATAALAAGTASGVRAPTVPGQALIVNVTALPGAASGGGTTLESKRERVLKALYTALNTTRPAGSTLLRNAVLPERIPAAGLMILRDGDPGEPQFLFSPPLWFYEHRAEIDVLVDAASPAACELSLPFT